MKLPWQRAKRKTAKPPAPRQEEDELSLKQEALEDQAYIEGYREVLQNPEIRRQLVFKKWQIEDPQADPIRKKRAELSRKLAPQIEKEILENEELRQRFVQSEAESMMPATPEARRPSTYSQGLRGGKSLRSEADDVLRLFQAMGYRKETGGIYKDIAMQLLQALSQNPAALAQQPAAQPGQPPPQQQAEQAPGPPHPTRSVVMPDGSLKEMSELEYALRQQMQAGKVRAQPAPDASVSSAPVTPCPALEVQPSARVADTKPPGIKSPGPEPRESYVIYVGKAEPRAEGGPPPVIRP